MATYPTSAKTFVTRAVGQTIQPAHVNDLQDEITALEQDLVGGLPIARGGTGQTTQAAAFDALAPSTTKGDVIVFDGNDHVRLGVGTDGQVLGAESSAASGLAWVAGGGLVTSYQTFYNTQLSRSSASGTAFLDTGLSVTFTPAKVGNIILVMASLPFYCDVGTIGEVQLQEFISGVGAPASATWVSSTGPVHTTVSWSYAYAVTDVNEHIWKVQFRYVSGANAVYSCYGSSHGTLTVLEFRA